MGNADSGKSTLARTLGKRLDLPVVHLDTLYWEPDWVDPDAEQFRLRVSEAIATNAWMYEGNYARHTFELCMDFRSWLPPRYRCGAPSHWPADSYFAFASRRQIDAFLGVLPTVAEACLE